jgi:hypothetical protein
VGRFARKAHDALDFNVLMHEFMLDKIQHVSAIRTVKLESPDSGTLWASRLSKIRFFVNFRVICLAYFREIEYHNLLIGVGDTYANAV